MRNHIACFKYLMKHKWYVFLAGLNIGAPIWNLIIHDWSKFTKSEWSAYVHAFYTKQGNKQYKPNDAFDRAWNHHQKINPHHWQYWILLEDEGATKLLEIPDKYRREMLADWIGAGRAINGRIEVREWYYKNKYKIQLHENTRLWIEEMLEDYK